MKKEEEKRHKEVGAGEKTDFLKVEGKCLANT